MNSYPNSQPPQRLLNRAARITMSPLIFLMVALLPVWVGAQTILINSNTLNGSFELPATGKITFSSGNVPNWLIWAGASNDSGTQVSANSSQGTRDAYLQPNNADYNLTTYIANQGDQFTFSWDHVLRNSSHTVSLVYSNAGTITSIPGTAVTSATVGIGKGGTFTIPAGSPAIGHVIGIGVTNNNSNYPEVDNFVLTVVPSGSTAVGLTSIAPANQVYPGTAVTLSAGVGGTGPFTNFLWQSDGATSGVTWTNLPGSVTNTYSLNTTGMTPATYQFRLIVTANGTSVTNTPGSLIILTPAAPLLVTDTVISPATTVAGNVVTLSAAFSGAPTLAYQWQKSDNATFTNNVSNATNSTYTISDAAVGDTASYRLVCTNSLGKTSSSFAALTVTALTDVEILNLGNTTPVATGFDIAQLSSAGNIGNPSGLNYYTDQAATAVAGQTFTTGTNDSGYLLTSLYIQWGSINGAHAAANPYTLCLYSVAGNASTLLTTYTNNNSAAAMATGNWTKWIGLSNILAPNATYAYSIRARDVNGIGAGFMQIGNASGNPYGGGSVGLFNSTASPGVVNFGTDTSEDATFLVHLTSGPPSAPIIQSVNIAPVNVAANPVYLGTPVTLSAVAIGSSPRHYQWQSDNGSGGVTFSDIPNATNNPNILSTSSLSPTTQYLYQVVITNSLGSATSSVVVLNLTNASGPVPVSGTTFSPSAVVIVGNDVGMTASFIGSLPFSYQWKHAGTNIPGALSNSFTITGAQFTDAGTYTLVASNNPPGVGPTIANSAAAVLYVVPPAQNNSAIAYFADGGNTTPVPGTYDISQLLADLGTTPPVGGATAGNLNYYVDQNTAPGQTFTTGTTPPTPAGYQLDHVYLEHDSSGTGTGYSSSQTYTLRVYQMLDGTNAQLLTSYVTTNAATFTAGDWVLVGGLTNVLKTNTTYAFALHETAPVSWWKLAAHVSSPDAYPGGQAVSLPALSGPAILSYPDINFGDYYDAAFVAGLTAASAVITMPDIGSAKVLGGNFVLIGSGGTSGSGYSVLSQTNLAQSLANWSVAGTGTFDGNGNFAFTNAVSPSTPKMFYRIRVP